jgi:hypothetical protein
MMGGFYDVKCSGTAVDRIQQMLKAGVITVCADTVEAAYYDHFGTRAF